MMLRELSRHRDIKVVHQLRENDTQEEKALFEEIRVNNPQYMLSSDPLLEHVQLEKASQLLVKQGVYAPSGIYEGIGLVRNPASVYTSLLLYDYGRLPARLPNYLAGFLWLRNRSRIVRWLSGFGMPSDTIDEVKTMRPLDMFSVVYNYRMHQICDSGVPIVHYEHFVDKPYLYLEKIATYFGLDASNFIPWHHSDIGMKGHGKNDLSRQPDKKSMNRYTVLSDRDLSRIDALTCSSASRLGYILKDRQYQLNPVGRALVDMRAIT